MNIKKIYKATMVETVYDKVPNGIDGAMTSAEFGEMTGKDRAYLTAIMDGKERNLVLGKYLVEKITKDRGDYVFWVEEVEARLQKVKGTKEIIGGCRTIANELGIRPDSVHRNCREGFLVGGDYLITEVKDEGTE